MIELVKKAFPAFGDGLLAERGDPIEHVKPPATLAELEATEALLGLALPSSLRRLLLCTNGFWLWGGAFQFHGTNLFFHDFPPFESLSAVQRRSVALKGGAWPPPSHGMLCFAEYFAEADGDQVLFDTSHQSGGEFPVVYYAHERRPPVVRTLAPSFEQFINELLLNAWFD